MTEFSVGACIQYGWETFKKRPWFIIGALAASILATNAPQYLLGVIDSEGGSFARFLVTVLLMALGVAVQIVLLRFWIMAHDSLDTMKYEDVLNPRPFWKYIGGSVASGLVVFLGLILLIVPGVIAALAFYFTLYLIVEKQLWPIEAMKESVRITRGYRMQLLLFTLAVAGLNILGFLCLIVGLLVSIPVTMIATVHAYRFLQNRVEAAPVSA